MSKVTVVARTKKNNDIDIQAYWDKDTAGAALMEEMYGEDWEIQMEDEEWELSDEIKDVYQDLMEFGWYSFDGTSVDGTSDQVIVIKEVEIY